MLIPYVILATIAFWLFFIVFAVTKERVLPHVVGTVAEVPVMWIFLAFGVFDATYNITLGSIFFMQLPARHRLTLSARLRYILGTEASTEWRYRIAERVCLRLIEPWLPRHCALR